LNLEKRGVSMTLFIVILISYFIGNFSTSYILGKSLKSIDIRNYGSGNAGATNVLRVLGAKIALITFLADALKGVLAVYIGGKILGYDGELLSAIFVILGHNWPVLLKFKGGKGVATTIGVMLTISPILSLIIIIIGIIILLITKYVSLSSILGMILLPILGIVVNKEFEPKFFGFTLFISIMAIYRHRNNIVRLISGNESKVGQKV